MTVDTAMAATNAAAFAVERFIGVPFLLAPRLSAASSLPFPDCSLIHSTPIGRQLDLREAAIHKQFRSSDEAAVVRCQEDNGFRNFVRSAEPPEWNCGGNRFLPLGAGGPGGQQIIQPGRVNGAGTYGVDANAALL